MKPDREAGSVQGTMEISRLTRLHLFIVGGYCILHWLPNDRNPWVRIDVEKSASHQLSQAEIASDNPVLDIYP